MRRPLALVVLLILFACPDSGPQPRADELVVASKKFTESVILGEALRTLAEDAGVPVRHQRELGGTRIVFEALVAGQVDAYVEYSGTLTHEIFAGEALQESGALEARLAGLGVTLGPDLGFENTYALGMLEGRAAGLGITRISDLIRHPGLRLGFTSEFMERADGWPALLARYGLPHSDVRGLDHDLAYRGLTEGSIDVVDLYTTDAEIAAYGLRVLEDDRSLFPEYRARLLYRSDLEERVPGVVTALESLGSALDEDTMARLNARARIEGEPEARVAADWARAELGTRVARQQEPRGVRVLRRSGEHLALVGLSLGAALLVALPLGIAAARFPRLGQVVLALTGMLQTIPSLALLVLLIPLLGIGAPPAIAALFLYSLLPIVRNTTTGLRDLPLPLRESAEVLGLGAAARLLRIDLPLATSTILAGVKTAAVINVGTATLGALIGAGGYGQPILTGIRLNDVGLILEGALPAAALAITAQGLFEALDRLVVPRGLRLDPEE